MKEGEMNGPKRGYLPEYQAARRSAGTVGRAGGGWESERGRQGREEEEEEGSGGGGMQQRSGARGIRGCAGEPYSFPSPRLACLIGGCVAGRAAGAGGGGGWLALSGPPPLLLVCSLLEDEMG